MTEFKAEITENANGTGRIALVTALDFPCSDGQRHNVMIWSHAPHVDGPISEDAKSLFNALVEWTEPPTETQP